MLSKDFLAIIRCPEDRSCLTLADMALVNLLNAAIRAGKLKNRAGQAIAEPLDGALLRDDHTVVYPIVDDIPILLIDEGIMMDQISASQNFNGTS